MNGKGKGKGKGHLPEMGTDQGGAAWAQSNLAGLKAPALRLHLNPAIFLGFSLGWPV
jgi:hypothetical protein